MDEINRVSGAIVDSAVGIHRELGPGLLESVYHRVLVHDLVRRGFRVRQQQPVSFRFRGLEFRNAFRMDLLVDDMVVVEIKSVETLLPVHFKQVLTYIRLADIGLGVLLNFGAPLMKHGIHRIINSRSRQGSKSAVTAEPGSITQSRRERREQHHQAERERQGLSEQHQQQAQP